MAPDPKTNAEKIATNSERIARLEEGLKQVCENHIPHIYEAINDVRKWVQGIAIGGLLAIIGLIIKAILE